MHNAELNPSTPFMLFGGQSMKAGVLFDAVRSICSKQKTEFCGMSGTNDLISIIVGLLAGVNSFETDLPLDLASKN